MEKKNCNAWEAPGASQDGMLAVQQFLQDNYRFRRNVLNGKVEFSILPEGNDDAEKELDWRPLTPEAIHVCFRKPEEGEAFKRMKSSEVLQVLRHEFPSIPNTLKVATDVGVALNALGYEFKEHGHVKFYRVIPLKAA